MATGGSEARLKVKDGERITKGKAYDDRISAGGGEGYTYLGGEQ